MRRKLPKNSCKPGATHPVPSQHLELHNRARVAQPVTAKTLVNNQKSVTNRETLQRRAYQGVPHEDIMIKASTGDVVLVEDVLKPVHAFKRVSAHAVTRRAANASNLSCAPLARSAPAPNVYSIVATARGGCITLPLAFHSPGDISACFHNKSSGMLISMRASIAIT